MQDVRKLLNVNVESAFWDAAAEKAAAVHEIPEWLTEKYILEISETFELFKEGAAPFIEAVKCIRENENLLAFAKTLYFIVAEKGSFSLRFKNYEAPIAPEGAKDALGYDLVTAIVILGHVKPFSQDLLSRGFPLKVIYDTFNFLRGHLSLHKREDGSLRFDKPFLALYSIFVYRAQIIIGRLRFEFQHDSNRNVCTFINDAGDLKVLMHDIRLHKSGHMLGSIGCTDEDGSYDANFIETDEYFEGYPVNEETHLAEKERIRLSKSEWKILFKPGDTLLKVHISGGSKLDKEACQDAYARARKLFKEGYPEFDIKAFVCRTWLFCQQFKSFLKPDSNILKFQNDYFLFPVQSNANDVFLYVYEKEVASPDEVDFESLPENNSMQKNVKEQLLNGEIFYEYSGFIPF